MKELVISAALVALLAQALPVAATAAPAEPVGDRHISEVPAKPEPSAEAREEQRRTVRSTERAQVTFFDDYYDLCDDASRGDLARFGMSDDQGRNVTFGWATCNGKPLRGSSDEVVAFEIDHDLSDPNFAADFVVLQWADDGYYAVFRTYNGAPSDRWTLIDDGFGDLDRSNPGNTQGFFTIDAVSTGFPYEYYFAVVTLANDQAQDIIPNEGHPFPTFPSMCDTVVFRDRAILRTTDVGATAAAARAQGLDVSSVAPGIGSLTVSPVADLDRLSLPGVVSAERPSVYRMAAVNDPEPTQWAIDQLDLDYAWQLRGSARNEIAIIDSGIDAGRPDLAGRVATGYDAVSGQLIPAGANSAFSPHGTAVAAIAAGARNNASEVAGVNGGAVVRPYNVFGHNGPCVGEGALAAALDHIATVDSIRIVNMSLGGPVMDPTVRDAIRRVAATGKILVAATGNDATVGTRSNFPAGFAEVIGVGATGAHGQVASYSQPGNTEFVAPGGDGDTRATGIAFLDEFDSIAFGSGTSFAAPYVSGALSLWLNGNRATTEQARAALQVAARDLPGSADGRGLVHVPTLLRGGTAPAPEPEPAPRPTPTAVDTSATCDDQQQAGFSDTDGNVHEYTIRCIVGWRISQGKGDGTYRPGEAVSRGQVATFVLKTLEAAGVAVPMDAPDAYRDDTGDTHEPSLNRLANVGIPAARPADVRPKDHATRAEMAEWVVAAIRYAGGTHEDRTDWYHDDESHPLQTFINDLTSFGVVTGSGDGTYGPDRTLNRAQMATFLARTLAVARQS